MNDQDMLTEVVKRGVTGGAQLIKTRTRYLFSGSGKLHVSPRSTSRAFNLNDLIADHAFMKLYGEVCYKQQSNHPIDGCCFFFICAKEPAEQQNKKSCHVPASLYRALEAFKLLHDPEGNAIKYLYDNLPENV